jgi:hypothetical protein
MASSSSTPTLTRPVSEKLTRDNFTLWKAQVIPAIRGAIDETVKAPPTEIDGEEANTKLSNPAYEAWMAQDQSLLSYINSLMSREVLEQVADEVTSAGVWKKLQEMYSSQSRVRVIHLCGKLSLTRKGEDQSYVAYFTLKKGYADEMAAADKQLDDDAIVSYILLGLDVEYNPMVEYVYAKTKPTTLSDLHAQMMSTDARLDAQNSSQLMTVNVATRGGGCGGFG